MNRIDIIRSALNDTVPVSRQSKGFKHLIGAGSINSARKRYCMFFRWMTRKSYPDFHLYKNIHPSSLVIPLDTHIMKVSSLLRLRKRNTPDWKTALEITENRFECNCEINSAAAYVPPDPTAIIGRSAQLLIAFRIIETSSLIAQE